MMSSRARYGYIMVETVVAMGLLSTGMVVIHGAIRQTIIARGQAQDFTVARFLLEEIAAEKELQPELVEGSGQGNFPGRFLDSIIRGKLPKSPCPARPCRPDFRRNATRNLSAAS